MNLTTSDSRRKYSDLHPGPILDLTPLSEELPDSAPERLDENESDLLTASAGSDF